jgi:hypothetical protein
MHVALFALLVFPPLLLVVVYLRCKYLDAAVRSLHQDHRELWSSNGEPVSYVFNPKDEPFLSVINRAGYTEWELASQECAWEKVSPKIQRLVRLFRYSYWGSQLGLIAMIILAVIWGGFTTEGREFLDDLGRRYREKPHGH